MTSLASLMTCTQPEEEERMGLITLFVIALLTGSSMLAAPGMLAAPAMPAAVLAPADTAPDTTASVAADTVNINTADVKALMTLDGVGRRLAEKIVEYRTAHGPFKKPEEVRRVEGLGAGLWARNRNRIVVK
jgi:competence protein ComEA